MKNQSIDCTNCGARLDGAYCAVCGQKRFVEADRRFGNLVRQFVAAATDLDGRLWGTLRALLLQPGRLSRDYIDGRRVCWMAPITLFLLVNVLTIYIATAMRRIYSMSWGWSIATTLGLLLTHVLFNLCVYRPALFLTVFAVT